MIGGVALVDVLAGPGAGFLPVLSLGPALAALSRRPLPTALVGTLALILKTFYTLERSGALLGLPDLGSPLDQLIEDVLGYVGHTLQDDAAILLIGQGPPLPPVPATPQRDGLPGGRGLSKPSPVVYRHAADG